MLASERSFFGALSPVDRPRDDRLGEDLEALEILRAGAGYERANDTQMRDDENPLPRQALDQLTHESVTALAELDPRLPTPRPDPGLTPLESEQQLGVPRLDLRPCEPGPASDIELAQPRVDGQGKAEPLADPGGGPARAGEIARKEAGPRPSRRLGREASGEGGRLREPLLGQVGIGVPLPTPLPIPAGFSVADQAEGSSGRRHGELFI